MPNPDHRESTDADQLLSPETLKLRETFSQAVDDIIKEMDQSGKNIREMTEEYAKQVEELSKTL